MKAFSSHPAEGLMTPFCRPDRVECALRRRPIRYFACELPLDREILQALQVTNCLVEQLDGVDSGQLPVR
jgi:hypothetical protein